MISILLDFMEKKSNKVIRPEYFKAITSVEPSFLSEKIRTRIFNTVFDYFREHKRWLFSFHDNIAYRLAGFYSEAEHYDKILSSVDQTKNTRDDLYVRRVNGMELINCLTARGLLNPFQLAEWRKLAYKWLKLDPKENEELHRSIVHSTHFIKALGFDWLKSIRFIFEKGLKIQDVYARTCFDIAPENPFSIDVYFDSHIFYRINKNNKNSVDPDELKLIFKLKTSKGISYALDKWNQLEKQDYNYSLISYRLHFTKDNVLYNFKETLIQEWNASLFQSICALTLTLLDKRLYWYDDRVKEILTLFIELIFEKEPTYNLDFIKDMLNLKKVKTDYLISILSKYSFKFINENNFVEIHEEIMALSQDYKRLFVGLFFSENFKNDIKEQISRLYPDEIEEIRKAEEIQTQKTNHIQKQSLIQLCQRWEKLLEHVPGQYYPNCFSYFIKNKEKLSCCNKYEENRQRTITLALQIVEFYNPLNGRLEKNHDGAQVWGRPEFKDCIELLAKENVKLSQNAIDNIFRYLPFISENVYEHCFQIAKNPSQKAIQDVLDVYSGKRDDDLAGYHPGNLLEAYKSYGLKEAEPFLIRILESPDTEAWIKKNIIEALPREIIGSEKLYSYLEKEDNQSEFYDILLCCLITKYADEKAIKMGLNEVDARKDSLKEDEVSHMRNNRVHLIVDVLVKSDYSIEYDKNFLKKSIQATQSGKANIASFYHKIIARHLEYLKNKKSFEPLIEIENFVEENKNAPSINWFEYDLAGLKRAYLEYIFKPDKIIASIKKYNSLKEKEYLPIPDSMALLTTIKEIINVDLRRWIEGEGAYKYINELAQKKTNKNAEDFIQKTIKSQIELALLKKGFRDSDYKTFSIKREEQLLDDKRLDFTISYGFVGSIVLELKLADNNEANANNQKTKDYVNKLKQYMDGADCDYGIFLIFNTGAKDQSKFEEQISSLNKLYSEEKTISVIGLNCL